MLAQMTEFPADGTPDDRSQADAAQPDATRPDLARGEPGQAGAPPAYAPPSEARPRWAQDALGPASPPTPSYWLEPEPASPLPPPGAPRAGLGPGGLVALLFGVALLAAVLAAGGTYLALAAGGLVGSSQPTGTAAGTVGAGSTSATTETITIDEQSAVTHAAQVVGPAVVTITSREVDPNVLFGSQQVTGIGSGVIFDPAGWILTNRHVVCGASQLQVSLADGRSFTGTVYGTNTLTDLAIGSPLGNFTNSVTAGIISASNRDIQVQDDCNQGQTVGVHNLLQTDAAINPGNSGGALVDSAAQVIGINTAVAGNAQGIGFAIPIDIAKPIMQQALAGRSEERRVGKEC